ncbi:MAG: hypothetical protein ACOVQE_00765 [Chitinophagaceae bacterium]
MGSNNQQAANGKEKAPIKLGKTPTIVLKEGAIYINGLIINLTIHIAIVDVITIDLDILFN